MAFRWSQNASSVTITFPVAPSVKKSDVDVTVANTTLRAGVKGSVPLCEGTLTSPVKGFKWSLKGGIVSIQLEKSMKVQWKDLLVPSKVKARVLFDYTSRDPVELTIHVGDLITVLNEDSSGWWKGDLNGKIGLFPSNFTEVVDANPSVPEGTEDTPGESTPTGGSSPGAPAPTVQHISLRNTPPSAQPSAISVPSSSSSSSSSSSPTPPTEGAGAGPVRMPLVASNDAMQELRNKLANRAGEEPRKISTPPTAQPAQQPPTAQPAQPPPAKVNPNVVRALYEYAAVEEGELSFPEGARIEVITRDESGWWQGQCGDAVGWFPAEYVAELNAAQSPAPSPVSSPKPAHATPPVAAVPALSATPTPPAPAAAHAPVKEEGEEEEEIREDDIVDLSAVESSQDRLVVPRRSMGGLRRKPSRSTLQRATAKALANASRFDDEDIKPVEADGSGSEENADASAPSAPASTPAPAPASGMKGPAPPPGEKPKMRPPPSHTLPPQPTIIRTKIAAKPPAAPDSEKSTSRVVAPALNRTPSPPPAEDEKEKEKEEDPAPAQPKATVIKRPPPTGRPKVAPRKNTPTTLTAPDEIDSSSAPAPSPARTPSPAPSSTPPSTSSTSNPPASTRVLGSRPAITTSTSASALSSSSDGSSASDPPAAQGRVPARGPSAPSLNTSGSLVSPPVSSTLAPASVTSAPAPPTAGTRKLKPPPPALFTKQQHLQPTESTISAPLSPTHPTPPAITSAPSSSSSLSSSPSKWPAHYGTFQEFCTHITSLLSDAPASAAGISPRARARASVGLCTVDGHAFAHDSPGAGDWEGRYFTLGLACAPFVYCAAVDSVGLAQVRSVVREEGARGDVFSELPHPYSTAGNIAMCGKLISSNPASLPPSAPATSKTLSLMRSLAGQHLSSSLPAYFSLRHSASTDAALAHYMKATAHIDEKVSATDALDVHFALKSVEVDVKTCATLAASLAANGVCPTTQKQCVLSDVARICTEMLPRVQLSDKEEEGILGWTIGNATILIVPSVLALVIHSDDPAHTLKVSKGLALKLHLIR